MNQLYKTLEKPVSKGLNIQGLKSIRESYFGLFKNSLLQADEERNIG